MNLKSAFSNFRPVVIQYVLQGEAYIHLFSMETQESRGRLPNFTWHPGVQFTCRFYLFIIIVGFIYL